MKSATLSKVLFPALLLGLLAASCSSQQGAAKVGETAAAMPVPPRTDSVLEFSSMVTAMLEDSKGNYWFGSHHDGLCRYDGKEFAYFTTAQGLPNFSTHPFGDKVVNMGNCIRGIREDAKGNILVRTGDGISLFDGESFRTRSPVPESILITESFDAATGDWQRELDSQWFGVEGKGGVHRYDGKHLVHLTFPVPEGFEMPRYDPYAVYSLYQDRDENLWFGTESAGIFRYRKGVFECINADQQKGIVRCFFQDRDGRIWIANNTVGLCYYEGGALGNFTEEQGHFSLNQSRNGDMPEEGETLDGGQSIGQDSDGNLWFGTFADGLWQFDGKALVHHTAKSGLPSNTVKTIFRDSRGRLWFGIGRGNVYGYDGNEFQRFESLVHGG